MMQNTTTHVVFDSVEQAKHFTQLEFANFKFSIIDEIDNIKRYSDNRGDYEFMLCYPELSVCNHWQQKVSPLAYTESNSDLDADAIGLKHNDKKFTLFKGLMLSTHYGTLFDCESDYIEYWGYSVGIAREYLNFTIPGPSINYKWYNVQSYELYLRVPSIVVTYHQKMRNNIELSVLFFVLIESQK